MVQVADEGGKKKRECDSREKPHIYHVQKM